MFHPWGGTSTEAAEFRFLVQNSPLGTIKTYMQENILPLFMDAGLPLALDILVNELQMQGVLGTI
jgi:hypothetical protein